jgi:hypothetical protein
MLIHRWTNALLITLCTVNGSQATTCGEPGLSATQASITRVIKNIEADSFVKPLNLTLVSSTGLLAYRRLLMPHEGTAQSMAPISELTFSYDRQKGELVMQCETECWKHDFTRLAKHAVVIPLQSGEDGENLVAELAQLQCLAGRRAKG